MRSGKGKRRRGRRRGKGKWSEERGKGREKAKEMKSKVRREGGVRRAWLGAVTATVQFTRHGKVHTTFRNKKIQLIPPSHKKKKRRRTWREAAVKKKKPHDSVSSSCFIPPTRRMRAYSTALMGKWSKPSKAWVDLTGRGHMTRFVNPTMTAVDDAHAPHDNQKLNG